LPAGQSGLSAKHCAEYLSSAFLAISGFSFPPNGAKVSDTTFTIHINQTTLLLPNRKKNKMFSNIVKQNA
jgi:hypothetical protein